MKKFLSFLLLMMLSNQSLSYPSIQTLYDNKDYLLIEQRSLPIVDLSLTIKSGSRDDDNLKGLTSFSVKLLEKQFINGLKIIDGFEEIGAEYTSRVNKETSEITIRFLSTDANFEKVSSLLNALLKHQQITPHMINDLKEKFIKSIKERNINPASILSYRGDEIFFDDSSGYKHPVQGYKSHIEMITLNDVKLKLDSILKVGNINVNLVGDLSKARASHFIGDVFNGISVTNKVINKTSHNSIGKNIRKHTHIHHDSKQTHIAIYIPSINRKDENFYNLLVANYIFGGSGFGSMLMNEIRVKEGLAYSVYSYLMPYENFGILKIGMQTENKNRDKSINILKEQINKFKNLEFNIQKIESAKKGLLRSFSVRFDTNKKTLSTLSAINEYDFHERYFEDYERGLMDVTESTIRSSLSNIVSFSQMTIITVGNDK